MSYISTCIADGAGGLWSLGDSSGTTAVDETAHSNGTYVNAGTGTLLGQTGIPGGGTTATRFVRASSGMVTIPSVAANQTSGNVWSIEIWIKRASNVGATQNIMCGNHSQGPLLYFSNSTNIVKAGFVGADICNSGSTTITADGNWHHIVFTKNGTSNHLYIDGVDVTSNVSDASVGTNTGGWYIGRTTNDTSTYQDGTVAMAAVYNVTLSSSQVSNHYLLGSSTIFSENFGGIGVGVGGTSRTLAVSKTFGGISVGIGGASRGVSSSRSFGAISTGIGNISKTVALSKSFGAVGVGTSSISVNSRLAKNFGAVAVGIGGSGTSNFSNIAKNFGGISADLINRTTGAISVGIGGVSGGVFLIKSFGGISAEVSGLKSVGAIGSGVGRQNKSVQIIRNFGAISPGVGGHIHGALTYTQIFGAISPGVGGQTHSSQIYTKVFGGFSPGVGGAIGGVPFAKTFGAISANSYAFSFGGTSSGVGRFNVSSINIGSIQKSFGGISANGHAVVFGAITPGVGRFNVSIINIGVIQKTFGGISANFGVPSVKTFGAIAPGVGKININISGTIQKSFGSISIGIGGTFKNTPVKTFGGISTGVGQFSRLLSGSFGYGAFGAGPFGGDVSPYFLTFGGISSNTSLILVSKAFGAIAPGIGGEVKAFGSSVVKTFGSISPGVGTFNKSISTGFSRSVGSTSPGIGSFSKAIIVTKSFGATSPAVGQFTHSGILYVKNFGGISTGITVINIGFIGPKRFGAISVGVSSFDQLRVAGNTVRGVSITNSGVLINVIIRKTFSSAIDGVGGVNGQGRALKIFGGIAVGVSGGKGTIIVENIGQKTESLLMSASESSETVMLGAR